MARRIRKQQGAIVRAFAGRPRELRVGRGLSQARLARKAGVNLSYLNKLERGEAEPGLELIAKLADALGVPLGEMVSVEAARRDPIPALRAQALENFGRAVQKGGSQELAMMAMLGSLLDSALSRNR